MSIKDQISTTEPKWYAVKCKYRCERRLVEELTDQGIECYTPIRKRIKQYASRKKQLTSALIPSHVFVKITRDEYLPLLQHQHIFGFLNFSGILLPIPEEEMTIMRRVVGEMDDVEVVKMEYAIGEDVDIVSGELTGLSGKVIDEANGLVVVALESLGMDLRFKIDPKYLLKTTSLKYA